MNITRLFLFAVPAVLLLVPGCVRQLEKPAERIGSFDVTIDFDAQPSPGVALATCTCPFGGCDEQDLCPGDTGSKESPIPFPGDRWATLRIDVTAVGTEGTRPFPMTGPVTIGLRAGELFGPSRQTTLIDGEANDVIVRMRRTPGATRVWVEDSLPRDDGSEPTYAAGASDVSVWFAHPKIEDIQITDDECCNALQGQRVEITSGELYITRLVGNGFNLQDLTSPEWGGLFVFAFNGTDGLRTGTKLLELDGAITEFQSATQLTEPTYVPVNGLCERPKGAPESGQETDIEETGFARAKCPSTAQCQLDNEGVYRCTPDGDPGLDEYGRRICVPGNDGTCPPGMRCQNIEGQGSFCQVAPVPMIAEAFPTAPYCGPITTSNDLSIEALEGMLVELTGQGTLGVRLEGLPVCELPAGDDPIGAVRSSCNLIDIVEDESGNLTPNVDCTQAANGDPVLRDANGRPCLRNNQACRDDGVLYANLRSSCLDTRDPSVPRCQLADPGDPVLIDREEAGDPIEANSRICRNTLDDFLTGGFRDFGQSKVYFEDSSGETRCATVNFDAITGFDSIGEQEAGTRWSSVTGTLRQVRFQGGSSFWMIDVRFPEDLKPL
jgi:hypothetical protein